MAARQYLGGGQGQGNAEEARGELHLSEGLGSVVRSGRPQRGVWMWGRVYVCVCGSSVAAGIGSSPSIDRGASPCPRGWLHLYGSPLGVIQNAGKHQLFFASASSTLTSCPIKRRSPSRA